MSENIFIFDLDSTITSEEILPKISKLIGKEEEMIRITENTMQGVLPFKESFIRRVNLLSSLPISYVQNEIEKVNLNEEIADFIKKNHERCYIVTGNLDIWICKLLKKLNMENHCFCSKAIANDDKLAKIVSIIDKKNIVSQFIGKLVVVGDGSNDAEMIEMANVGIGFGGVRPIAPSVLETCKFAIYDQHTLVRILNNLL